MPGSTTIAWIPPDVLPGEYRVVGIDGMRRIAFPEPIVLPVDSTVPRSFTR